MENIGTDFTKNDPIVENLFSNSDISSTTDFVMPGRGVIQKRPLPNSSTNSHGPPNKRTCIADRAGAIKWNLRALSNAADSIEHGGKSPVSVLNELGMRVVYTMAKQEGPAHRPNYTINLTVADMTFEGWGHSKREARAAAARACLAALLARAGRVLTLPASSCDFTQDDSRVCPEKADTFYIMKRGE